MNEPQRVPAAPLRSKTEIKPEELADLFEQAFQQALGARYHELAAASKDEDVLIIHKELRAITGLHRELHGVIQDLLIERGYIVTQES